MHPKTISTHSESQKNKRFWKILEREGCRMDDFGTRGAQVCFRTRRPGFTHDLGPHSCFGGAAFWCPKTIKNHVKNQHENEYSKNRSQDRCSTDFPYLSDSQKGFKTWNCPRIWHFQWLEKCIAKKSISNVVLSVFDVQKEVENRCKNHPRKRSF